MRVLIRPEQVTLTPTRTGEPRPDPRAGRDHRADLRRRRAGASACGCPPLPGVRQVVPPLPFGEENPPRRRRPRARLRLRRGDPWVVLEEWHILRQPTPRLLVCDEGRVSPPLWSSRRPCRGARRRRHRARRRGGRAVAGRAARVAAGRAPRGGPRRGGDPRAARANPPNRSRPRRARAPYDFVILGRRRGRVPAGPARRRRASRGAGPLVATPLLLARGRPRKPERILICTAIGEPGKADVRAGGWLARRLNATVDSPPRDAPGPRAVALGARASGARRRDAARARGPEPLSPSARRRIPSTAFSPSCASIPTTSSSSAPAATSRARRCARAAARSWSCRKGRGNDKRGQQCGSGSSSLAPQDDGSGRRPVRSHPERQLRRIPGLDGRLLRVQLPVRLGVEHDAADVVARLVERDRLEELVLRQARVLPTSAGDARRPAVVGRQRQQGRAVEPVQELAQVRRAEASVDARVVEKRPAIPGAQDGARRGFSRWPA